MKQVSSCEKYINLHTFRDIKDSIHALNACSPFKDAYKNDAPNFVPETAKRHNKQNKSSNHKKKASPPTPVKPLQKVKKPNERGKHWNLTNMI